MLVLGIVIGVSVMVVIEAIEIVLIRKSPRMKAALLSLMGE